MWEDALSCALLVRMEIDVIFPVDNLTKTFKIFIPLALLGLTSGKKCFNYLPHKRHPLPGPFRTPLLLLLLLLSRFSRIRLCVTP